MHNYVTLKFVNDNDSSIGKNYSIANKHCFRLNFVCVTQIFWGGSQTAMPFVRLVWPDFEIIEGLWSKILNLLWQNLNLSYLLGKFALLSMAMAKELAIWPHCSYQKVNRCWYRTTTSAITTSITPSNMRYVTMTTINVVGVVVVLVEECEFQRQRCKDRLG